MVCAQQKAEGVPSAEGSTSAVTELQKVKFQPFPSMYYIQNTNLIYKTLNRVESNFFKCLIAGGGVAESPAAEPDRRDHTTTE